MKPETQTYLVRHLTSVILTLGLVWGVYKGTNSLYLALAASCAAAIYRIGADRK